MFLPRLVVMRDEEIEADLADGGGGVVLQVLAQSLDVARRGIVRVHRMDAVGGRAVREALAQGAYRLEIAACHRGEDEAAHAGSLGVAHDVGLCVAEFGGVEVAVGVDEHAYPIVSTTLPIMPPPSISLCASAA